MNPLSEPPDRKNSLTLAAQRILYNLKGNASVLDISTTWRSIVEGYSRTSLTYASDRLIALAGVSRLLAETTGGALGDYHAGLWQRDLVKSLGWRCLGPSLEQFESYLAPSWSWASTTRAVMFRTHPKRRFEDEDMNRPGEPELVRAEIVLKDPLQPYCSVRHGKLKLNGLVCRIRFDKNMIHLGNGSAWPIDSNDGYAPYIHTDRCSVQTWTRSLKAASICLY